MPDVEKLLGVYLLAQSEVTSIVSTRVYKAALPKDAQGPLVRLQRVSGQSLIYNPLVLDQSRIQFDCYGGSQTEANRLAETVRALLDQDMNNYVDSTGTIVSAICSPPFYAADPDWPTDRGGPKPRYIFDCVVTSKLPLPA